MIDHGHDSLRGPSTSGGSSASALAALPDAMPLLQATLHNGDIFYIEISFYSFIRVHQAGYSLTVFEEEAQVLK